MTNKSEFKHSLPYMRAHRSPQGHLICVEGFVSRQECEEAIAQQHLVQYVVYLPHLDPLNALDTYTDEEGTTWIPPTAEAYAKVCKAFLNHTREWRRIDSAPKTGEYILISWKSLDYWYQTTAQWVTDFECKWVGKSNGGALVLETTGAWTDHSVVSWTNEEEAQYYPTHWMPLPAPPPEGT